MGVGAVSDERVESQPGRGRHAQSTEIRSLTGPDRARRGAGRRRFAEHLLGQRCVFNQPDFRYLRCDD
jgi:hypothetical protein